MRTRRLAVVSLVTALSLCAFGRAAAAAQHEHDTATPAQQQQMAGHQQMMARMAALDQRIAALTKEMNAAAGDARVTAMANLLNAFVEAHTMMRSEMLSMGGMMPKGPMMQQRQAPSSAAPGNVAPEDTAPRPAPDEGVADDVMCPMHH